MSVLGVVICVAATVLVGALMVNAASTKVELRGDNDDVSRLATTGDSLRFDWWSESVDRWGDARVFGQGGQAFEVARAMRTTVQDPVAHPHSLALQVLVEAGLIGLMVGLAAGLAVLRATLGAPRSPERAVASGVAVMILLQAAIDWTWSLPQVMAIGALALAILLPGRSRDDHPVLDPLPRVSVRTSLATLGIFAGLAVVALIPALAGLLADQSARDIDAGDPASGADFARQSMELVPDFNTLQLEVLALEAQGKTAAARRALEERERVWWPLPSGLQFAQQRYPTDSKQYQRIQRRLERP